MKKYLLTAAFVAASALTAIAQTSPATTAAPDATTAPSTTAPAATTDGNTPAVATPETVNPTAPVEGANSFTEAQAKSRIEARGFTNVSALKKDDSGVWRGTASQGGKSMTVSVDFGAIVLAVQIAIRERRRLCRAVVLVPTVGIARENTDVSALDAGGLKLGGRSLRVGIAVVET